MLFIFSATFMKEVKFMDTNEKTNEERQDEKTERDWEEIKKIGKQTAIAALSTAALSWIGYQAKCLFESGKELYQEFKNRKESE